jgi:transketolase
MRTLFCQTLVNAASRRDFVFLTGDLGFQALEGLAEALGARFINAGVAEQNMISVAAGLARSGLRPWAYSIAPFIYARPFEQIRNDICLHNLPVVLVGNGGGYGYGVMGPTHHGLEDYGTLLTLANLKAYIPAFDDDIPSVVQTLFHTGSPAYLRLGISEAPVGWQPPGFAPWRKLLDGDGATLIVVGPLVGGILAAARELPGQRRPRMWLLSQLPCDELPDSLIADVQQSQDVLIVEEHVAWGGAGRMVGEFLLARGQAPRRFRIRAANGYPSGRYGSQRFHRQESRLDSASIMHELILGDT